MARPRIYKPGETPGNAHYQHVSRKALADRGGRILQVRLEPGEVAALERLRAANSLASDRDVIAYAIRRAVSRIKNTG